MDKHHPDLVIDSSIMSATQEALAKQIRMIEEQITLASQRGEDITDLVDSKTKLVEQLNAANDSLTEGTLLKG